MIYYLKALIKKFLFLSPRFILISILVIYATFALLTYFDYFEPYLYPIHFLKKKAYPISENIIIGPYPHYEEIKILKEEYGITTIVSLLNLDLPQEKALYKKEKKIANKLGMNIYNFSLEYVFIKSESNRNTVQRLIRFIKRHNKSKIYIHCYFGKHRVGYIKKELFKAGIIRIIKSKNRPKT